MNAEASHVLSVNVFCKRYGISILGVYQRKKVIKFFLQDGNVRIKFTVPHFKLTMLNLNDGSPSNDVAIYAGIGCTMAVIFVVAIVCCSLKRYGQRETQQRIVNVLSPVSAFFKTVFTNRASVYMTKRDWSKPDTHWSKAKLIREILDDLLQNALLVAGAILSVALASRLSSSHNPLVVNNEVGDFFSADMLVKDGLQSLASKLNLLSTILSSIIIVINSGIVAVWTLTKIGDKTTWMKVI